MRKRSYLPWGLALIALLGLGASARAQILIERLVTVNRNVADGGTLISGLTWSEANLSSVTWTAITLNFSSPFETNPMQLGDLSSTLRFGSSTESPITATVFSQGGLTSASQTFTLADNFDGAWKPSDRWELRVTDNIGGGIAKLDSWKISVQGQADSSGTLTLSNGERISTATGEGTGAQTTVSSTLAFGNGTVDAEALANKVLTFSGGLSGTGTLRASAEAGGKVVLAGNSTNFTGIVRVLGSGTTEIADFRALGAGSLEQTNSQTLLRFNFSGTMTNQLTVSRVSFATNGATLAGRVTVNNADFDVASGDTNTVSGETDGSGTVTKLGGGTLVLSGTNNSYTGITDVRNGTLRAVTVANSNANSSIGAGTGLTIGSSNNAGTFVHTATSTTNSMNREVLVGSAGGTFSVDSSDSRVTLTGNVANQSGNATLTKSGAGTLALGSGANVSVSTIAVQQGTLLLGASNQIDNNTAITLSGGTLALDGKTDTVGRLTVSANSIFDFGTAGGSATTFTFSDFNTSAYGVNTYVMTINNASVGSSIVFNTNYDGNTTFNSFASKIQFGTSGQFGQISFGSGTTTLLVAIPDARVYTAAAFLFLLIGVTEYRRRRKTVGSKA